MTTQAIHTTPQRTQLVNETVQAFAELALTQKFADMPSWMDLDITVSQLKAIYLLAFHGTSTVSELARLLNIGKPAASILIQQLVRKELVNRSEDTVDRRRLLVSLTERGEQLVSSRRERREAAARRWLMQLRDEELAGLSRGLQALLTIVQQEQNRKSEE